MTICLTGILKISRSRLAFKVIRRWKSSSITTEIMQQQAHGLVYFEQLAKLLENNRDIRETAKSVVKNTAIIGGSTVVGLLVLGPVGAAVGATASAVGTVFLGPDSKMDVMVKYMRGLQEEQKIGLSNHVIDLIGNDDYTFLQYYVKVKENGEKLLNAVREYLVEKCDYDPKHKKKSFFKKSGHKKYEALPSEEPKEKT